MKNLLRLLGAALLAACLYVTAFAGDMDTPLTTQPPPTSTQSTATTPTATEVIVTTAVTTLSTLLAPVL